jgi:hypothetical protein
VELAAAADAFAAAEAIYSAHKGWDGVAAAYADAVKWRGVALFELNRRDEAVHAFTVAKGFDRATELTEAMVRPDVARAFAAAPVGAPMYRHGDKAIGEPRDVLEVQLGLDDVVEVAIAIDAGVLTYAATRARAGCATDVLVATRPDELVRRLDEATCKPGSASDPSTAPAIAHPRPAPSLTKTEPMMPRRTRVWDKPLLWVGVVGAVGVGVVLAVNLWPRDASYSIGADFHQFALSPR